MLIGVENGGKRPSIMETNNIGFRNLYRIGRN